MPKLGPNLLYLYLQVPMGEKRTLKKKKSKNKEAGTYLYTYVYLPTKYSGEAGPIAGISYRKVMQKFFTAPLKKKLVFPNFIFCF